MPDKNRMKAILWSNSIAVQNAPKPAEAWQACPFCGQSYLKGRRALWQHLEMRHDPFVLQEVTQPAETRPRQTAPQIDDSCETALIRISNAGTLEEAIELALGALIGEHAQ